MRLILYRELRLQPWWLLALAVTMTASLGIAWGTAAGPWLGWPTGIVTSVAVGLWWWSARSAITVEPAGLQVGRMFLEAAAIGEVRAFTRDEFLTRTSGGSRADDVNSLLARQHGGVTVQVADDSDPFGAWVIGSRKAAELTAALESIRGS